jgi:hypothetical protein
VIFHDQITVHFKVKTGENALGQPIYDTIDKQVYGTVTYLDSAEVFDVAGDRVRSRLLIVLSPFDTPIPPDIGDKLTLDYGPYTGLVPDGAVEPHYLRGRLHHYEVIAKVAVTAA